MDCASCREILSAALDGEATPVEAAAARTHAESCLTCARFARDATRLHAEVRVASTGRVPDLTAEILAASGHRWTRREQALRLVLIGAALVSVAAAIPVLAASGGAHADHADQSIHHLGTFDLALAAGFAWVAWRPRRARAGFLPVGTVLAATCIALSVFDAAMGNSHTLRLASHGTAVVGLLAAWAIGRRPAPPPEAPALSLAA